MADWGCANYYNEWVIVWLGKFGYCCLKIYKHLATVLSHFQWLSRDCFVCDIRRNLEEWAFETRSNLQSRNSHAILLWPVTSDGFITVLLKRLPKTIFAQTFTGGWQWAIIRRQWAIIRQQWAIIPCMKLRNHAFREKPSLVDTKSALAQTPNSLNFSGLFFIVFMHIWICTIKYEPY